MDLRELEAVVAVHEHGSFSGAAIALFISQPALTRRVAMLERELDLKLFVRSSRGVYLTDAGRALIEPAKRALRETDTIRRTLDLIHGGNRGTLSLTGVPNLSIGQLGHLIAEFHDCHPEVDVRISTSESTTAAIASVENGVYDLAIVDAPVHSDSVVIVDVWEDDYLAVYSSSEPRRNPDHPIPLVTAELLRNRPMIRLPESLYPRQQAKQLWEMVGVDPASTIETQHHELLVAIARGGQGIAVVPRDLALQAYDDGAHVAQPPRPISRIIGLARRRDEASPTIGRFLRLASSQRRLLAVAG